MHRQLTLEERYHVEVCLKEGRNQASIARALGRSPSTISRELRRNGLRDDAGQRYLAAHAAKAAHVRRIAKGEGDRRIRGPLQALVEQKLRLSWSPEQISGRLEQEAGIAISHETIYQGRVRKVV